MSKAPITYLLMAFLLGLSTGCSGSCAGKTESKAEHVAPPDLEAPIDELKRTLESCKEGLSETMELVDKAKTINDELEAEAKIFEEQGILEAIPTELETEKAKKQIEAALEKAGHKAIRVQVEYHEVREKKNLPRYFPGPPPYPYTNAELEEVIRIHVDLSPFDEEQKNQLLKALSESAPRLIRVEIPLSKAGFSRIPLDIFRFRRIAPPTQSYTPPSKPLLLKAQGLAEEGPNCHGQRECLDLVREIDGVIAKLQPLRPKAELTLRLESELDMWKARRKLFNDHAREIQARLNSEKDAGN